jgi:serine/threonine protein kinase
VFECVFEGEECAGKRVYLNGSKELQNGLLEEISIMEKMSHPNVISLKRKFIREQEIILLMPRFQYSLEQGLQRRLKLKEPLNISEIVDIFSKIVEGLLYIHSQGIAHRDLKVHLIEEYITLTLIRVPMFSLIR